MEIIIKKPMQIVGIRKSCQLASQTLDYITEFVKPGVTTNFLDAKIEKFIRDNDAFPATLGYKGYPKSCCISINEEICHGIPSERELKDGDIATIDVTTILDGYYGDTARTYTIGKISEQAQKLVDTARECLEIGIKQIRPGNYIGNIGFYINKYAVSKGFSTVRTFVGHGCGVEFHEPPQVFHIADKDSGIKLRSGMTITCEPMINCGVPDVLISESDGWTATTADGKLSAQFEHTILVTHTGHEILTV